ncbi:MAG: hypothetical protein QOF15_4551, partial [Mycobacterium sp.]|nr:hypothetical protein [Mycobacterium sp.]
SPVPGVDCQPFGTVMVIRGAAGSDTVATVGSPSPVGVTTQAGVSSRYKAPFTFTGGIIAQVTVDLSGRPYEDVEKDLALAFSRD